MQITRKKVMRLALGTLVFMTLIGVIIIEVFHGQEILDMLLEPYPWYYQLGLGAIYGILTALIGWQLVRQPQLNEINSFFTQLIGGLQLSNFQIVFISFCAGTGEEILFRGALQPFLGIWITAILFVLLHGYLNPRNLPMTFYGLYMVLVIAGIGYLAVFNGLITAISAHFFIDCVLIARLQNNYRKTIGED